MPDRRSYVESDRFFACAPAMPDLLVERGTTFDATIAIWVLQHCERPVDDLRRLKRALGTAGRRFVVNDLRRAVPVIEGTRGPERRSPARPLGR